MSLLVIHPLHKLLSMCNKLKMEIMTRLITFSFLHYSFWKSSTGKQKWFFLWNIKLWWGKKKVALSFIDCFFQNAKQLSLIISGLLWMALWFFKKMLTFFETHTSGIRIFFKTLKQRQRKRSKIRIWQNSDNCPLWITGVSSLCILPVFVYFTALPSKKLVLWHNQHYYRVIS